MKIKRYAVLSLALVLLANGAMFLYQPSFRVSAGSPPGQVPRGSQAAVTTWSTPQGSRAVYSASLAISLVTQSVEKNLLVIEGFAFILGGFLWRKRSRTKPATAEV